MNIHSVSIKGIRNQNEDRHSIISNLDNSDHNLAPINFFGVYDGHGGKFVSGFLADSLPSLFIDKRINYPISKDYINQVFRYLQQKILKKSYYDKALHCGSTCLVGIHYKKQDQDYLNVINSGDTRCVLCRDNFAIPLSKDHKPMWPEERHRIQKLGGTPYFDGDDWRIKDLSVSRSFGDFDAEPYLTNMPDVFRYKLDKNDKFIVFACDGLWDVLSNQDVVNFILNECYDSDLQTRINKTNNIAKKLAEYALHKGSTDNLTIIVYFLV
jgi:serine/threonine protein phosphatase PrpC